MPTPSSATEALRLAYDAYRSPYGFTTEQGLALQAAIKAVLAEPQGHPETITYKDRTYRNVGQWGVPHVKRGDIVYIAGNRLRVAQHDYRALSGREQGWLDCASYSDAALYRLEPLKIETTATIYDTPEGIHVVWDEPNEVAKFHAILDVKVTIEEAGVPSKEQP